MMGHKMCIIKIFFILLAIATVTSKFHEDLSTESLKHYFGTTDHSKVPEYEFLEPTQTNLGENSQEKEYSLKAFGETYTVRLQRNQHLIAPGCVVLQYFGNETSTFSSCLADSESQCYYHGYSSSHNQSSVALSTCDGLHGVINLPDHDIYVQPIKSIHLNRSRRHTPHNAPHLVYKRNVKKNVERAHHARTKRSGTSYFAELRVVVAPDDVQFHGNDVQKFVITAINIAAARYKDPSVGVNMNLAIVEILLLHKDDPNLDITKDSTIMLANFCPWQERKQPPSSASARYADGAIFITRQDLHFHGDYSNLGLGHQEGMCRPRYRCSVNEDNGLDLGLTIAHEIGHLLGMRHDGEQGTNCPNKGNIMSPNGGSGASSMKWSECSKNYIKHFLSMRQSDCLTDRPTGTALHTVNYSQKPGTLYTAAEQCQLALQRDDTDVCVGTTLTNGNECQRLVCEYSSKNSRQCAAVGSVRLDGTECDSSGRKWCIGGQCVPMRAGDPGPIHGGWSEYDNQWSECTRTCGGGLRMKTRKCNNPSPRYGGRDCQGEKHMAQLCNMQPCPESSVTYRDEQCSATNSAALQQKYYHWIPYENDLCVLKCYDATSNVVAIRGRKYHDGTDCSVTANYGQITKCLDGKCATFGCDGVKGNNIQFDNCGMCGGDGRSCMRHSGTYNQGREKEFVTFVTVPKGSTTIRATNANKYCKMSVRIGGTALFNEGATVSLSKTYNHGEVKVEYKRRHTVSPESIHIQGPLSVHVELQVYRNYGDGYVGVRPEIEWSYYSPKNVNIGYTWKTFAGTCSQSCGTGYMIPRVLCVKLSDNTPVDNKYCNIYQKPRETRVDCNTRDCPPEWFADHWKSCSKSCGRGTKSRDVACVIIQRDAKTKTADNRCNLGAKPSSTSSCNVQQCPGQWRTGSWSACSATCGSGEKTRTVTCHNPDGSNDENGCLYREKPAIVQECLVRPCDFSIQGTECEDKVNCRNYEEGVCQKYKSWASRNCKLFCGICVKDPSLYLCRDEINNCEAYGTGICTNPDYKHWVNSHCARFCGTCGNNALPQTTQRTTTLETAPPADCHDKVNCILYSADVCSNPHYSNWAIQNCRMHCGFCHGYHLANTQKPTTTESPPPSSCHDLVNCNDFASDICNKNNYRKWALKNCRKHCKLCTATTTSHTAPPATNVCKDLVQCDQYASDVCTNNRYSRWANINCQKFCGFCTECKDRVKCSDYGADVCSNSRYSNWAHRNCPKHCGFCSGGTITITTQRTTTSTSASVAVSSCADKVDCTSYQSDVCTNAHYSRWAHQNCVKHCGFCKVADECSDKVDCGSYADDICTSYKSWATKNCAKSCGICKPCEDTINNCEDYASDMCTKYGTWAVGHCKKHCNLCGSKRRKRADLNEVSEILNSLMVNSVAAPVPISQEIPMKVSPNTWPNTEKIPSMKEQKTYNDSENLNTNIVIPEDENSMDLNIMAVEKTDNLFDDQPLENEQGKTPEYKEENVASINNEIYTDENDLPNEEGGHPLVIVPAPDLDTSFWGLPQPPLKEDDGIDEIKHSDQDLLTEELDKLVNLRE